MFLDFDNCWKDAVKELKSLDVLPVSPKPQERFICHASWFSAVSQKLCVYEANSQRHAIQSRHRNVLY